MFSRARASLLFGCVLACAPTDVEATPLDARVLVFSATSAFRHASIEVGTGVVEELGECAGFFVASTESAADFTQANLANYDAVVWLNTSGDVLNETQQAAFEAYIQSGGGYVGIHSASDTEYDWPWYGELLGNGAWFLSHPLQQSARVDIEDPSHVSTAHFEGSFELFEEWYSFQADPSAVADVLLTIDESTYVPDDPMGPFHPIAWNHEFDGGRSWYTAIGHRIDTWANDDFRNHVRGGITWAAGLAPESTACGDADGNGTINATDALASLSVAVGTSACADCVCDVDASGAKTSTDALTILSRAIGLETPLECLACLC